MDTIESLRHWLSTLEYKPSATGDLLARTIDELESLRRQLAEANAELLKQSTIAWDALGKPDGTYTTTTVERLAAAYTQLRGASGSCAECEQLTREIDRLNNWIEASAKLTHNDPLINKGEDAHQAIRRLSAEVERLTTAPSDAEIVTIRRRLRDGAIEFENDISSRGYSKFFDAMNDAEGLMRRAKAAPIAAGKDAVGGLFLPTSNRDWTADFAHENGNYFCRCITCGESFRGHKRRVVCALCAAVKAGGAP